MTGESILIQLHKLPSVDEALGNDFTHEDVLLASSIVLTLATNPVPEHSCCLISFNDHIERGYSLKADPFRITYYYPFGDKNTLLVISITKIETPRQLSPLSRFIAHMLEGFCSK